MQQENRTNKKTKTKDLQHQDLSIEKSNYILILQYSGIYEPYKWLAKRSLIGFSDAKVINLLDLKYFILIFCITTIKTAPDRRDDV